MIKAAFSYLFGLGKSNRSLGLLLGFGFSVVMGWLMIFGADWVRGLEGEIRNKVDVEKLIEIKEIGYKVSAERSAGNEEGLNYQLGLLEAKLKSPHDIPLMVRLELMKEMSTFERTIHIAMKKGVYPWAIWFWGIVACYFSVALIHEQIMRFGTLSLSGK